MSQFQMECWLRDLPLKRRDHVIHLTASRTLTRSDTGTLFTNLGATGDIVLTLPTNALKGDNFEFGVAAAHTLTVSRGGTQVLIAGGSATGATAAADDEGESIKFTYCGDNKWLATRAVGTWTVS